MTGPRDPRPDSQAEVSRVLPRLMEVIESRKRDRTNDSYVVTLLDRGPDQMAEKIVEEAGELAQAACRESVAPSELVHEVADLCFHTLVLMGWADVSLREVEDELERRFGTGGHEEKRSRETQ